MRRAVAIRNRLRRKDGQVLPFTALFLVAMLLFGGLVVDFGRLWVAQRQLQSAVDAAALAAGQDFPNATQADADAIAYSAQSGSNNQLGDGVTASNPTVTFECDSQALNYNNGSCAKPVPASTYCQSGCNAVRIVESATIKTTLAGLVLPSFTVTASATAAARGGYGHPMNVYVILDTTGSMTQSCGSVTIPGISGSPTKLDCAKNGMQSLLTALSPCDPTSSTGCTGSVANPTGQLGYNVSDPFDEVGLLAIPALTSSTPVKDQIDCKTHTADGLSSSSDGYPLWTAPSGETIPTSDEQLGYQAVGLSSDYRSGNASTYGLNWTTSPLVEAVDWGQCPSQAWPGNDEYGLKDIAGHGSYLAGAITEAQYLLQTNARPGTKSAIIILSDGQMTDSVTFENGTSRSTSCQDANNAATEAKNNTATNTEIYTIEYGADGSCGDGGYTGSSLMQAMASSSADYFNAQNLGTLTAAFQAAAAQLTTNSRLIPDCSSGSC